MKNLPSFLSSTLSLAFLVCVLSVITFIFLDIKVDENLLAVITAVVGAYIGSRIPSEKKTQIIEETYAEIPKSMQKEEVVAITPPVLPTHTVVETTPTVSFDYYSKLSGKLPANVFSELPLIIDKFQINTSLRMAHFLGQCSHESGNFKFNRENLNYSAEALQRVFPRYFPGDLELQYARQPERIGNLVYGNRMGNGDENSGEGYKFRGRGYIQLTGKNNYQAFSNNIGEDCVANPELVADKYSLASAAWFWEANKLNTLADMDDCTAVTRRINGGENGLADRVQRTSEFKQILGIV